MRLQEQVYQTYKEHIISKTEENRRGMLAVKEDLERSPLWWNGDLDKTLQIPKVFDMETISQDKLPYL